LQLKEADGTQELQYSTTSFGDFKNAGKAPRLKLIVYLALTDSSSPKFWYRVGPTASRPIVARSI